jgi:hypothetical protein
VKPNRHPHHERSIAILPGINGTGCRQKYDEELVNPPPPSTLQPVRPAELKAGAEERAKQRPLLQKILAVFRRRKVPTASSSSIPSRSRNAWRFSSTAGSRSSRSSASPTAAWSAASTRAGSRTSIPASRPPSSTSATPRTPSCTTGTCSRPPRTPPSRSCASTSEKRRPPARRAHRQGHPQPLSAGQRNRHPSHQGAHRHQRPPHHHQPLHPRPLPHPHPLQRGLRHLPQDRGPPRAQAPQADAQRTHHP